MSEETSAIPTPDEIFNQQFDRFRRHVLEQLRAFNGRELKINATFQRQDVIEKTVEWLNASGCWDARVKRSLGGWGLSFMIERYLIIRSRPPSGQ